MEIRTKQNAAGRQWSVVVEWPSGIRGIAAFWFCAFGQASHFLQLLSDLMAYDNLLINTT